MRALSLRVTIGCSWFDKCRGCKSKEVSARTVVLSRWKPSRDHSRCSPHPRNAEYQPYERQNRSLSCCTVFQHGPTCCRLRMVVTLTSTRPTTYERRL